MCILLKFLVEYRLSENPHPLKAYSIAVDALGRNDSFDTQIDSYPRVQMGRLRRLLDNFYLRNGGENRLLIPHGHYTIIVAPNEFKDATKPLDAEMTSAEQREFIGYRHLVNQPAAPVSRQWLSRPLRSGILAGLLLLLLTVPIAGYFLLRPDLASKIAYPTILVAESDGMLGTKASNNAESYRAYLIGAIARFEQSNVYDPNSSNAELANYILKLSMPDQNTGHIQLRLVYTTTGEVIWSDRIEVTQGTNLQDSLGKAVIAIAGSYGAIAQNELSKHQGDFSLGFPCLLQFQEYIRYSDPTALKPALTCMERSARQFPGDPYLQSMLGAAKVISGKLNHQEKIVKSGNEMASRAGRLNQNSATANFAMAQSAFFASDCDRGVALGTRAIELNPLNSRIMGFVGIYMLGCKIPDGEVYTSKALEMDPDADLTIAAAAAIQKLQRGDLKGSQQLTLKYKARTQKYEPSLELAYILSMAALNDKQRARTAWYQMVAHWGLPASAKPREVMSKWIANPDLLRELELVFDRTMVV